MARFGFVIFASSVLVALLFGAIWLAGRPAPEPEPDGLIQGLSAEEIARWRRATQGSRLMPYEWFIALEAAEGDRMLSETLVDYGYLPARLDDPNPLPIGFVLDQQAHDLLTYSDLYWYEGQRGDVGVRAEPWVGLNCSACHTGVVDYEGQRVIIEGGPTLADFQSMIEGVDAAMEATAADPETWERFAARVLDGKDTPDNRSLLGEAFGELIGWQRRSAKSNDTDVRYGHARLDAFGRIYNKVIMFADPFSTGNPADAPVSYPFLWGTHDHHRVQWNGIAKNETLRLVGGRFLDHGALGRNTGQVIGVFGDIVIKRPGSVASALAGYRSSVDTTNLEWMETLVSKLQAPSWPDMLPAIDFDLAAQGEDLYRAHCASCHKLPDMLGENEPIEVMLPFAETAPENQTDIWMACNAYLRTAEAGLFSGQPDGYFRGNPIGAEAKIATLLKNAVTGALVAQKGEIIKSASTTFFGAPAPPEIIEPDGKRVFAMARTGTGSDRNLEARDICLTDDNPILAYKARPLDGIWATAPYLHNGSVPTLYDLLLPAVDRPQSFYTGSSEFDPEKVGYVSDVGPFLFETRDPEGSILSGNSNLGHEYGVSGFTEADRQALVEFMKTL